MPAAHFTAWEEHLRECPPGDFLTQILVGELIQTVESFMCGFAGKDARPRRLEQIAPWLNTPTRRRAVERARLGKQRMAARGIVLSEEDESSG